jgi:hypothetical protein
MMIFDWNAQAMRRMIGATVTKIEIDKGIEHFLRFTTDKGIFVYHADAECCSETWFYHLLGVDCLLNHKIVAVEDTEPDDSNINDDGKSRQEWDEIYGIKITSDVGYMDIEFRNSSNGYYGGDLEYIENPPGRFTDEYWLDSLALFTDVKTDYTA